MNSESMEASCNSENITDKEENGNVNVNLQEDMTDFPHELALEIGFEVESPTGDLLCLYPVNPQDVILTLKMLLMEDPACCTYTCYCLQNATGVELNDYVEIRDYLKKGILSPGMRLKMEEEPYTVRQVRTQLRKMRELLLYPPAFSLQSFEELSTEMQAVIKMSELKISSYSRVQLESDIAEGTNREQAFENVKSKEELIENSDESNCANASHGNGHCELEESSEENRAALTKKNEKSAKVLKEIRNRIPQLDIPVAVNLGEFYPIVVGGICSVGESALRDMLQGGFARVDGVPLGGLDVSPPPCLKGISFSGWNPPPPARRLMGDLAYIEAMTLDDGVLHVTATPFGFYVNRTNRNSFDPTPADLPCHASTLTALLEQASPSFRKAWAHARQQSTERARAADGPLDLLALMVGEGRVDALTSRLQWNVLASNKHQQNTNAGHKLDLNRMEEDLLNAYGMDERGALRDWNEEYQSVMEMPSATSEDRLMKARSVHKILSDFADAAVQGAKAIFERQVAPLNPMEDEGSHVYAFNNIFFSFALDSRQAYQLMGGDAAAYKNCNHDFRNVIATNKMGLSGLSTLATSIVDYLGMRLIAQSIIPGILSGDHKDKLVYGAVEYGMPLKVEDSKMTTLTKQIAEHFLIAEREVERVVIPGCLSDSALADKANATFPNGKEEVANEEEQPLSETVKVSSAVEVKGILGADKRRYILDVVRLSPRDANWVPASKGGTGVYSPEYDTLPELYTAVLRSELVVLWARHKVMHFNTQQKLKIYEQKAKQTEEQRAAKELSMKEKTEAEKEAVPDTEVKSNADIDLNLSDEEALSLKEMAEKYVQDLQLNINVFMPYKACTQSDQVLQDEQAVREVSLHLWNQVLPSLIVDIKRSNITGIIDGASLTETLHQYGVNIRYLGKLADFSVKEEAEDLKTLSEGMVRRYHMPLWWLELLEVEMIARALKHILFDLLKERRDIRILPGPSLLRLLNCVFGDPNGSSSAKALLIKEHPFTPQVASKSKKNKGKGKRGGKFESSACFPCVDITHSSLWEMIGKKIKERFRYQLCLWENAGWKDGKPAPRALRTPLLRRTCQRLGLRVIGKEYDWSSGCPFSAEDLVDVKPVAKHCVPESPFPEASQKLEMSRIYLGAGNLALAFECVQTAISQLQVVCGGVHREVAAAFEISAVILLHAGDTEACVSHCQKALAFYNQLLGFDSGHAIACHGSIALLLSTGTPTDKAICHLKAYVYLVELVAGPRHPEITSAYQRMGLIFQEIGNLGMAMKCYNEVLKRDTCDRPTQAHIWHSMAVILHQAGDSENALASERSCKVILKGLYGEADPRTVESTHYIKQFTEVVVGEKQRTMKAQAVAALEEEAKLQAKSVKKNSKNKKKH